MDRTSRPSRSSGLQRSLPSSASGTPQICVRGTFLQVVETAGEVPEPLSPTSLSDPGSEVSGNSIERQAEKQSMEVLNKRMADLWSRASRSDAASASENSGSRDASASGTELQRHHPRQEAMSHLISAPGTFLKCHSSATDSPTSRSSLSTWQGISEDVHETLLRHQLEFPDPSHQASAATTLHQPLHQPEQLQYPLGFNTIHNLQAEEQHAHQFPSVSQGSSSDLSACMQHAPHLPWRPWPPHMSRRSISTELAPGIPQSTEATLLSSPHFANMVEGAHMPWMEAAAVAHRPQDKAASKAASNDLVSALSAIPEQVRLLLESTAQGVAQEVHGEVATMGDVIRYSSSFKGEADVAVEKLECIPSLILNSFEGKLMRVKDKVRRKVNTVIEDLNHSAHFREEAVKKLYTIPEEVVNITAEAMAEVSQDSQIISAQQIDSALLSCPQACVRNTETLYGMRSSIVASVPDAKQATSKAVHDTTIEAVEQAVAKVCDTLACPANEMVADQLLRIKAAGSQGTAPSGAALGMTAPGELLVTQNDENELPSQPENVQAMVGTSPDAAMNSSAACDAAQASNPGSLGHPELCPRPCLYFARGQCANGNQCDFCHLPHPKRPSHLDKRHREMLKRMPFAESVSVAMPVLREKARSLSLRNDVMELLDKLEEVANLSLVSGDHSAASSSRPPKRSGRSRNLQGAMRGITLRSLLTALHRSDLPGDSPERAALADLLRSLRSVAPEFPCDLNSDQDDP